MADEIEGVVTEAAADEPPVDAVAESSSDVEPGSGDDATGAPLPGAAVAEPDSAAEKEPAKETEATPKESAIARALRAREAKFVERQTQQAKERAEWDAYTEKLKPQIAAFNQERELAKADPFKWLESVHGIREEDLARRWINGGAPSKQEQEHLAKTAAEKRLEAIEQELAAAKAEKARREEGDRRAASQKAAEQKLLGISKQNASRYPLAARLAEADLIEEANLIAASSSEPLSYAQVLEKIEARAKRFGGATSAPPPKESAAQTATKGTEKQGQKGQEAEAAKSGVTAPTLNGKSASQRTSMPKDDPLALDPEEERRRLIAVIDDVKKGRSSAAA